MSVQSEIGQKIKEAIDFYLTQADSARLAAQLISDYWGERDYRWLAESGVITRREADIMLGVEPNMMKMGTKKPKRLKPRNAATKRGSGGTVRIVYSGSDSKRAVALAAKRRKAASKPKRTSRRAR